MHHIKRTKIKNPLSTVGRIHVALPCVCKWHVIMADAGGNQTRTPGCTRAHPITSCEEISNAFQKRTKTQAGGEFDDESDKPWFQGVASAQSSGNVVLADKSSWQRQCTALWACAVHQEELESGVVVHDSNQKYVMFAIRWIFETFSSWRITSDTLHKSIAILLEYVGSMCETTQVSAPARGHKMSQALKTSRLKTKHLFLIAATCVNMAYKLEKSNCALYCPSYMLQQLCHLMEYTVYDFVTVERDILQQGEWLRTQPKTPHFFMRAIFDLCAIRHDKVSVHATAMLDQCLQQDTLVRFGSYKLAVACILIALRHCNLDTVYLHKLVASVQKPADEIVAESMHVQTVLHTANARPL